MLTAKPATAKSYVTAIRSFHIENGFPITIFSHPRIELVIRGGKRVYGEGVKKLRLPLTSSVLLRIVNEVRVDEEGINVKAALCVAFAAFLRSGEFTWDSPWIENSHESNLSRKHVGFNSNNSITLTLPVSKMDPYRTGVTIQLASSPSPLCPVAALKHLYRSFPRSPTRPLFARPYGQPFTKQFIVTKIRELLLQAGISTLGFSGHSIRKGAAVTAVANGISKDNIKLLGRWKSDAVDIYINELDQSDHIHKLLHLNSLLHTPPTLNSLAPPNFARQ